MPVPRRTDLSPDEIESKDEARFWAKVDKTGDCWLWSAARDRDGYGLFKVRGRMRRANRVAYALVAPIPDGLLVDHTCHNPACVRSEHLRLATVKQNAENRKGAARDSRSGVRGVVWDAKKRKWKAYAGHNGRVIYGGSFDAISDASQAVQELRNEHFTHSQEIA